MNMDPRLAERRKEVAEERAKRTVRRLLRFLSFGGFVALVVWFMLSPYMSARSVVVEGVDRAAVEEILAAHSVVPGRPLILIRPGAVAAALEEDPWVARAEVDVVWPERVDVNVTERVPRAWVETREGWSLRDGEGVRLPGGDQPGDDLGRVHLPELDPEDPATATQMVGAIEFLMTLPPETAATATVRVQDRELWANVDGWDVRLGRADEMREKALSLVTLLAQDDLAEGSLIVLISPSRPSVLPPGTSAEDDQGSEQGEDADDTGDDEQDQEAEEE